MLIVSRMNLFILVANPSVFGLCFLGGLERETCSQVAGSTKIIPALGFANPIRGLVIPGTGTPDDSRASGSCGAAFGDWPGVLGLPALAVPDAAAFHA